MTEVVFLAAGVVLGWLLGRRTSQPPRSPGTPNGNTEGRRLTRKQQQIVAMLPPDPTPKTLEQLLAEEVEETGVDRITGAGGIPLPVRLKVYHRDRPGLGECDESHLRFTLTAHTDPSEATVETTHLVCDATRP